MNNKFVQKRIVVSEDSQYQRLDLYCLNEFKISRSLAQKLIENGGILVNNEKTNSKYLTQSGDVVDYIMNNPEKKTIDVPIIYEDDSIIVVNKPSGISVHPSEGDKDVTITEIFSAKINDPEQPDRPGIVHRLDKGTSGVLVLARNSLSREFLQAQFKSRKVKKTYLTLVEGKLEPSEGTINIPITRDLKKRNKMTVDAQGKEAKTNYKVLSYFKDYSYVEVKPLTGRTHQIRVHFSALGHLVVGDARYGHKSEVVNRIFLHAAKLEFIHPTTKKMVTFAAELPKELKNLINELIDN